MRHMNCICRKPNAKATAPTVPPPGGKVPGLAEVRNLASPGTCPGGEEAGGRGEVERAWALGGRPRLPLPPPRTSPGTREIVYFRETRAFLGGPADRSGRRDSALIMQACCKGCSCVSAQFQITCSFEKHKLFARDWRASNFVLTECSERGKE